MAQAISKIWDSITAFIDNNGNGAQEFKARTGMTVHDFINQKGGR